MAAWFLLAWNHDDVSPVGSSWQAGHGCNLLVVDACVRIPNLPRTTETLLARHALASLVTSGTGSCMAAKFTSPPPKVGLSSIVP